PKSDPATTSSRQLWKSCEPVVPVFVRQDCIPEIAHPFSASSLFLSADFRRSEGSLTLRPNYRPPPISRLAPVVYEDAEERKYSTASATSCAWPTRCIGTVGSSRSRRPGDALWIVVSMRPGDTVFTRIPSAATSRASP